MSTIEKLFISWKSFESSGVINYGSGWRTDVVNHCSECDMGAAIFGLGWLVSAVLHWFASCFLDGCLHSCITHQTGSHHINVLWQICIQCHGSEILWIKPLIIPHIHLTTIDVLTAEFLHHFLDLFVKAISCLFNSSQNEVIFWNGYRPLKTWVCISMSKISKQQVTCLNVNLLHKPHKGARLCHQPVHMCVCVCECVCAHTWMHVCSEHYSCVCGCMSVEEAGAGQESGERMWEWDFYIFILYLLLF